MALRFVVQPGGRLGGRLQVPGDKSISHRAVMLGALADERLVAARERRNSLPERERRESLRGDLTALLGSIEPVAAVAEQRETTKMNGVTIERWVLSPAEGIRLPLVIARKSKLADGRIVFAVCSQGKSRLWREQPQEIAALVDELRGIVATAADLAVRTKHLGRQVLASGATASPLLEPLTAALDQMADRIDAFIRPILAPGRPEPLRFDYLWHGLMGYTDGRVRVVGAEPRNPVLLYNLGCNGVGFLPSISGGRRVARLLAGERLAPSLFDPR